MFRILDAHDVDRWTAQKDGLYLRYNAAHDRFEGASPEEAVGAGVTLSPTSSSRNVITAQNATTTPLTLKGAPGQSADMGLYEDNNGGSLVRVTALGSIIASGSLTASGSFTVVQAANLWSSLWVGGLLTTQSVLAVYGSGSILSHFSVSGNLSIGAPAPPANLGDGQFGATLPVLPHLYVSNRAEVVFPFTATGEYVRGASGCALPRWGLWDRPLLCHYSAVPEYLSGQIGFVLDKTDATLAVPHGWSWAVSGDLKWGIGQDYDTPGGGGNADFVLCFDYSARGGLGADILRFSPAVASAYGETLCALGIVGTPRFDGHLLYVKPTAYGLGGIATTTSGGVGVQVILPQSSQLYDTPRVGFTMGGTTIDIFNQRALSLIQTLNLTTVRNYLLFGGVLSGTATMPRFTSPQAPSFGVESTDSTLSLFTAPLGNNQAPIYGLVLDTAGNLAALNKLTAGATTLASLTVTGSTVTEGNANLLGSLTAGAVALNSLVVTGTVAVTGLITAGQAQFSATNLNTVTIVNNGIGGLYLQQVASGGINRTVVNMNNVFQWGTDLAFNGSRDFWMQNLATGNEFLHCDVNDKVTLGTGTALGGVVVGVTGGKASFYGAAPIYQPSVTGSVANTSALTSLISRLAALGAVSNGLTDDPTTPAWAWINQGGATVTQSNRTVFLSAPANAGDSLRLRVIPVPASPYTITMAFQPQLVNANFTLGGLCLYNSGSGSVVTLAYTNNSGILANAPCISATKWTNTTTFNANYTTSPATIPAANWQAGGCVWFRIKDDGTNRTMWLSNDGVNFFQIHTASNVDFLVATHIGFFVDMNNASYGGGINVLAWQQS